jgi:tRNA(Ile)-lysidine synthase
MADDIAGGPDARAASARLLPDRVRDAVARHGLLAEGDRVLVAVSGGPDSVALLHALVLLRSEYALRLAVCHVHHGLRPEADRDAAFVERLAARLDCPARVVRVRVPLGAGRSPEDAARHVRHAALALAARQSGSRRIALGHTADDQAETVLMRVLQGAGPRGLGGIPRQRGRIIRPLLDVDRATVLAHLSAHGLDAVDDATNRDLKFLRNRVRHELLPLLAAQAGPRVPDALRRLGRASRETVEALDALVRPRLAEHLRPTPVGWRLGLAALTGVPPGAAKTAIRLALVEIAAGDLLPNGLRSAHLDALQALVPAASGARVRLPGGVLVERGRDALWLLPPEAGVPAPLSVPGQARSGQMLLVTTALGTTAAGRPADPAEVWFDADQLGWGDGAGASLRAPLEVRRRRPGERMVPFGGATPVRLGTLLAAAGVPRFARTRWPVVVQPGPGGAADQVLWVVGVRRAAVAPLTGEVRALRIRATMPAPGPLSAPVPAP